MNKNDIISKVYFDKSGYGSKKVTFDDVRKNDKSITKGDVDEFFKKNVEQKKQSKGFNSFVAPHAYYEYQIDLMFFNDLENQNMKVGMGCIDIFSKYATVVSIFDKKEASIASGILECFENMKFLPEIIYTDDEASLQTEAMKKYFKEKNIKHIITRSHAHFIERFIRTFKDALYKRIDNSKEKNIQWGNYIYEILLTYNNKLVHSSTGFTPNEARKPKNEIDVKLQLINGAKHTRNYPMLEVGSKVKILRKKGINEKERTSVWSDEIHKVVNIGSSHGQTYFKLDSLPKEYLRNEILKVS